MNLINATNTTGWAELTDGQVISAVFLMFDTALAGWLVAALFILYQFILFLKTRSLLLCFITGIFFASMGFAASLLQEATLMIIIFMLVLELVGIFYYLVVK
jgi:hypothetical protein